MFEDDTDKIVFGDHEVGTIFLAFGAKVVLIGNRKAGVFGKNDGIVISKTFFYLSKLMYILLIWHVFCIKKRLPFRESLSCYSTRVLVIAQGLGTSGEYNMLEYKM